MQLLPIGYTILVAIAAGIQCSRTAAKGFDVKAPDYTAGCNTLERVVHDFKKAAISLENNCDMSAETHEFFSQLHSAVDDLVSVIFSETGCKGKRESPKNFVCSFSHRVLNFHDLACHMMNEYPDCWKRFSDSDFNLEYLHYLDVEQDLPWSPWVFHTRVMADRIASAILQSPTMGKALLKFVGVPARHRLPSLPSDMSSREFLTLLEIQNARRPLPQEVITESMVYDLVVKRQPHYLQNLLVSCISMNNKRGDHSKQLSQFIKDTVKAISVSTRILKALNGNGVKAGSLRRKTFQKKRSQHVKL